VEKNFSAQRMTGAFLFARIKAPENSPLQPGAGWQRRSGLAAGKQKRRLL
jgi:hypothetical protein